MHGVAGRIALGSLWLSLAACGVGGELPHGVAASAEAARPLQVGTRAPQVALRGVDGRPVALADLTGQGAIALVFYRGGW